MHRRQLSGSARSVLLAVCLIAPGGFTSALQHEPPPQTRTQSQPAAQQPEAPTTQQTPAPAPETPTQPPAKTPAPQVNLPPLPVRAWTVLHEGLADKGFEKRAKAVHALGLLKNDKEADQAARDALKDEKPEVRVAAAEALASMHAVDAEADLQSALDDEEPRVVLAAANALLLLQDTSPAYDIYYGVLTGTTRTDRGFVREQINDQLKTLRNRKKMAEIGIEQGIGFIPFAGFGYDAYKTVMQSKGDGSPVRAAAAKKLAHDPSPITLRALLVAAHDKNWVVRAAALEALSERGDKSIMQKLFLSLDDEKEEVRFTGAACIAHLNDLPSKHRTRKAAVAAN